MLKVSCLIKNTQLQKDLKDFIEYVAYSKVAQDKEATIGSVYNEIRKAGIEVDLQTVGYLYNDVLPKSYKQFSSDKEVDDFVGRTYADAVRRASKLEDKVGQNQIGKDAVEVHVVNGLLNMFTNTYAADQKTNSDMKVMQDALWKGIQRKLDIPKNQNKPSSKDKWQDVIGRVLGYEQLGITDLNGRLNSIRDLYNEMKNQLTEASKDLGDNSDVATVQKWNDMVSQLEASTYGLLFSTKEAKAVLNDIMKEAGYAKKLKNGDTVLDWDKLSGISNVYVLRNNVQKVLQDAGYDQQVVDGVTNSLENEFKQFNARLLDYNLRQLQKKEDALDRSVVKKSDLKRLAELNSYGIFDRTHDRVLYSLLGVPDIKQEDIEDLKDLAQAASDLFREIDKKYGSDVFASYYFQNLQKRISAIISRNVNDKTQLLKVLKYADAYFQLLNTGLLMNPFNIFENFLSGVKQVGIASLAGFRGGATRQQLKDDWGLYKSVLADVITRGVPYGEEVGSFVPRNNIIDNAKWEWKPGSTLKQKSNSILYALTYPARIGLMALDSANKAVATNKTFRHAVYQGMIQNGISKEDAVKMMNESLNGQKFEEAKEEAKLIITKYNGVLKEKDRIPLNNNTITRIANDLVKANLNIGGKINTEFIEAAIKSSYHVAGLGLGHDPNNPLSSSLKAYRNRRGKKEQKLVKEKKWKELQGHKLADLVINNATKFMGGATNWILIRLQTDLGLGLLTGGLGGNFSREIDFANKDTIYESIRKREQAREEVARSLVGLFTTGLAYALYAAAFSGDDLTDEEKRRIEELRQKEEKGFLTKYQKENLSSARKARVKESLAAELLALQEKGSGMQQIKAGSYMGEKLFNKTAPLLMIAHYYKENDKNNMQALIDFTSHVFNSKNEFTTSGQLAQAGNLAYKGDTEASAGVVGKLVGSYFGVPLWSGYRGFYKLGKSWVQDGVGSDYRSPHSFVDGILGGGALENLGLYDPNPPLTTLPGIGSAKYELFKEKGITSLSDLAKHPDWITMKHMNESGERVPILSPTQQKKAKEAYEKYLNQK